jgi:hypothetical protein
MNVWKALFLVFWLALPVSLASGQEQVADSGTKSRVEVPKKIVEQLLEDGYEVEVSAAGTASNLEAHPIELNRGGEPALRVHGLGEICGAANCMTWVYQKDASGYRLLLDAGYVDRIEPQKSYTRGYRDLMAVVHGSAWESDLILYKFNGEEYQRDSCFFRTFRYEDRHGTLREWEEPKTTRIDCHEECC